MGRMDEQPAPVGMAGSHLNVPLSVAMERLGLRSQMRSHGGFGGDEEDSSGVTQVRQGYRARVEAEKSTIDRAVVAMIVKGDWGRLEPNSNKSVPVGNHHICVSFKEETEIGYRTWEWHGHMILYNDDEGSYKPEYIYGNYFEPLGSPLMAAGGTSVMDARILALLSRQQHRFY